MFRLIDIVDVMCGNYEHTPTWRDLNLGQREVLEVGHRYENVPVLEIVKDRQIVDFQPLEVVDGKLFVYLNALREPLSPAVLNYLSAALHTATLVEKKVAFAVVEAQYMATHIRADMVSLEIPAHVQEKAQLQEKYAAILEHAKTTGQTPVVFVPYTEAYMAELLPVGFKILDYLYAV